MAEAVSQARSVWRKVTRWYSAFLSWVLMIAVAILVLPVALQIFSRFTSLIPHYIWTEELARFLLVWTVMIGAMIGVRESSHFEVDVWPILSGRPEAAGGITDARLVREFGRDPLRLGYMATEWTVPLLAGHLSRKYGCRVAPRTLRRRMKRLGLRWKRPRHVFGNRDPHGAWKKGRSTAA